MRTLILMLAVALVGCNRPESVAEWEARTGQTAPSAAAAAHGAAEAAPATPPPARTKAKGPQSRGKAGKGKGKAGQGRGGQGRGKAGQGQGQGRGKAGKGRSQHQRQRQGPPPTPPVGVAGPMTAELTFAPAPAGEDAEGPPKTTATLGLMYGEGERTDVPLGDIAGDCQLVEPAPVGPAGKERMPLFSIRCTHEDKAASLAVVQHNDMLAVMKSQAPAQEGAPERWKPVKRVRLAEGAEITAAP